MSDPNVASDPLSALAPYPAPVLLDPGYDRHAPDPDRLRTTLAAIAAEQDWAGADWCTLVRGLQALGRTDVPLSRLAEGHIDALRVIGQAGRKPVPGALYGVWASRSRQTGVQARPEGDGHVLNGTIRFASGTGVVDRALVPVWLPDGQHLLIDLAVAELPVETGDWVTTAMEVSRSHTVPVSEVTVEADSVIGAPDFYLRRPGFFPGGVGVAACWAGGAARIADLARARVSDPKPVVTARLGRIRRHLATAGALVDTAARRLDVLTADPMSDLATLQTVSTETRAGVGAAVHAVLEEAERVTGPAGLAFDRDFTRAVHDLRLYVLQQNADADEGFLGSR